MKIGTSRYQRLECFIATLPTQGVYGRLVHVDETFNRFADFGEGKERGGRGRLGYLSRGARVPSYATACYHCYHYRFIYFLAQRK